MRRVAATGALGAALGLFGLLFGLPSLLVPGLALAILAAGAAAWVTLSARGAAVRIATRPATVQEGDAVGVAARARQPRWCAPGELRMPALGHDAVGAARDSPDLLGEIRPARRGWHRVGPARLTVRDPLGLAERTVAEAATDVLVLPRIEAVKLARHGALEGSHSRGRHGTGPELEFDLLRPHRTGSPASRIHWPTVARVDALVERRLRPEADSRPLVVLDPGHPESEEALDCAVRAAASLTRMLAVAGGCHLLMPGDRRATSVEADLRTWPAAHARLALLEEGGAPLRVSSSIRASAVFWVLAARRQAPRALTRAGTAHRYLVTPGPAAAGAAFVVAGCAGARLDRARTRAA